MVNKSKPVPAKPAAPAAAPAAASPAPAASTAAAAPAPAAAPATVSVHEKRLLNASWQATKLLCICV